MDWFVLTGWSAFSPIPIYWIPVHAAIGFWRRLGGRTYWFALVVWVLLAWVFLGHRDFWFHARFRRNLLTYAAGFLLLAVELVITRRAGALLGFNRLVGRSELEPDRFAAGLQQQGLYARVRHPRYLGAMAALFGLALLGSSWRLLGAAVASVPLYYLMTVLEERELRARFGDEFLAYRRRVPRFLPHLRRIQ